MQPISELNPSGDTYPAFSQDEHNACKTWHLMSATNFKCECCKGFGHEYFECPFKKKLDKFARSIGETKLWGSVKWNLWYGNLSEEKKKLHANRKKRNNTWKAKPSSFSGKSTGSKQQE